MTLIDEPVIGLMTLQFSWGGLFDAKPDSHDIHLVRLTAHGTPGPTLCGIDRFDKNGPGWSVGGGVSDREAQACESCATLTGGLPIVGMFAALYSRPVGDNQKENNRG